MARIKFLLPLLVALSAFLILKMPNWISNAFRSGESSTSRTSPEPSSIIAHVNAVYYPNWKVYRHHAPSSLNLDRISHVFYAFAWPNSEGTVSLSDAFADTEIEVDGTRGCISALIGLKARHTHLKVILSIGGGGPASSLFPHLASNDTSRQVFSKAVRDMVDAYSFDGVDIDWEYPNDPQQGVDYIHLLHTLRAFLPAPRYVLTSALPASQWSLRHINVTAAASYLNFINLMTYDFAGPWVDSAGHHAQLYSPQKPHNDAATLSCDSAIQVLLSIGVPANKIVLGIPAYGRSFVGAAKVGQAFSSSAGEEGTFEYKDLPRPGAKEQVDKTLGAAYCVDADAGFVSYDNPDTVRMKATYARQLRLGGLFYWTGTADVKGERSLIEAGYTTLHYL